MEGGERFTIGQMVRTIPVESALMTLLPAVLVVLQLGNSLINGLPLSIAGGFAVGLLGSAFVLFHYRYVRFKRQMIEADYLDRPLAAE